LQEDLGLLGLEGPGVFLDHCSGIGGLSGCCGKAKSSIRSWRTQIASPCRFRS
jgi:hypothetical protein